MRPCSERICPTCHSVVRPARNSMAQGPARLGAIRRRGVTHGSSEKRRADVVAELRLGQQLLDSTSELPILKALRDELRRANGT